MCEEHSESPIRHRLKLPKLLCAFWSDRFIHFGHTEITNLIQVFNLDATNLNFLVTPSCSNCLQLCISVPPSCSTRSHQQGQAIYTPGPKFGNFSETLRPRTACSASSGLRIVLLIASDLPPLVSATVNGILLRRCRRSKSITSLGYGFESLWYS